MDREFYMGQNSSPAFFTEKEAAAFLSVSLSTMHRWRRAKIGPGLFSFGGVLRYRREALEDFISQHTNGTA
jgi:helix-turn-helix protein